MSQKTEKAESDNWGVWESPATPRETHVYPCDDSTRHSLTADCWCKPERDRDTGDVLVHNRQRDFPS